MTQDIHHVSKFTRAQKSKPDLTMRTTASLILALATSLALSGCGAPPPATYRYETVMTTGIGHRIIVGGKEETTFNEYHFGPDIDIAKPFPLKARHTLRREDFTSSADFDSQQPGFDPARYLKK